MLRPIPGLIHPKYLKFQRTFFLFWKGPVTKVSLGIITSKNLSTGDNTFAFLKTTSSKFIPNMELSKNVGKRKQQHRVYMCVCVAVGVCMAKLECH